MKDRLPVVAVPLTAEPVWVKLRLTSSRWVHKRPAKPT